MLDRTSQHSLAATKPRIRFAYLILTDGRCIGSNHFGPCGLDHLNQWDWIVGHLISEFGCNADDVSCVETDEGDRIAVNGKIVCEMVEE
jgi:hypothetical protein